MFRYTLTRKGTQTLANLSIFDYFQNKNREFIRELTIKVGCIDAPRIITMLEKLGVQNVAELTANGIRIPAVLIGDVESLRQECENLAQTPTCRSFPVALEGNYMQVDTLSISSMRNSFRF